MTTLWSVTVPHAVAPRLIWPLAVPVVNAVARRCRAPWSHLRRVVAAAAGVTFAFVRRAHPALAGFLERANVSDKERDVWEYRNAVKRRKVNIMNRQVSRGPFMGALWRNVHTQ